MARLEIEITALDRASGQLKGVAKSLDGLDVKTKNLSSAFRKFEGTLVSVSKRIAKIGAVLGATLSGALSGLGYAMVRTNAQFEKFQLTLETLYRSQSKAKQAMDAIMDFAAKTPFELEQVTSAFVRLKTYGFEPLQNDTLRILGDVAAAFAGMGKTIDDVVEALADATVGEFERLKEFGIKASVEGQKVILRYVDAHGQVVQKVVEKNEEVIRSTLLAIWNEKYGGQMQKLSGSWDQIMSNIKDNWTRFMKAVGESGAFQALKERLKALLETVDKAFETGKAQKWAEIVGKAIVVFVDGVSGAFKIMVETGKLIVDIGAAIIDLGNGIYDLYKNTDNFWTDAFKGLVALFGYGVNKIAALAVEAGGWVMKELVAPVAAAFEWVWEKFKNAAIDAINWVAEKISSFVDKVVSKIPWLRDKIQPGFQPLFEKGPERSYEEILKEHQNRIEKNTEGIVKFLEEGAEWWKKWGKQNSRFAQLQFKFMDDLKQSVSVHLGNVLKIGEETSKKVKKGLNEIQAIAQKQDSAFKQTKKTVEEGAKKVQEKAKSIWDRLREFFSSFWKNFRKSRLGSILDSMWQGIKTAWGSGAKEGETGLVAQVKNTFSNILSGASVGGLFGAMGSFLADQLLQNEKIRETLQKIFGAIQKLLTPVAEVIAPVIEVIADILMEFKPVFKLIADLLKPIASAVREMLKLFTKLDSFFRAVVKPVFDVLVNVLKGLWNAIKALVDAIKSLGKPFKKAKDALADLWDNTIGSILHQGGLVKPVVAHRGMFLGNLRQDEVPVIAQQGEYIVNREATSQYLPILQAINEGKFTPQANITVNVYAQSFDRDFVENELIPLLDDLKRRGKWS